MFLKSYRCATLVTKTHITYQNVKIHDDTLELSNLLLLRASYSRSAQNM